MGVSAFRRMVSCVPLLIVPASLKVISERRRCLQ
jgi:hypothetical protein